MVKITKKQKGSIKTVSGLYIRMYKNVLMEKKRTKHEIKRVQSKSHQIGTYRINKMFLSCFDDKDIWLMMK